MFDKEITIDASNLPPLVTWGTSPQDVISIEGQVPNPADIADEGPPQSDRTGARLYGADGRHADAGGRD